MGNSEGCVRLYHRLQRTSKEGVECPEVRRQALAVEKSKEIVVNSIIPNIEDNMGE